MQVCSLDEEVAILDLYKYLYFGASGMGAHIEKFSTRRVTWTSVPGFLASLKQAGFAEALECQKTILAVWATPPTYAKKVTSLLLKKARPSHGSQVPQETP